MTNISDLIGTPDYYELKIPYAIFPKSEYLKFETRIIKNDKTHPFSYIKPPQADEHIQAGIVVGEEAPLPSFLTKTELLFKNMNSQEQMAVIYHELLHLLISYHILMLPEVDRMEKNTLVKYIFPNGFSNLVHDFMIDTVGNELVRQQALLRLVFDDFDVVGWHYYNFLKDPKSKRVTLEDFFYGNYLEGHKYEAPNMFELPPDMHPAVVQAYDQLNSMIKDALEKFLNGIINVTKCVREEKEGYTDFFSDEFLLSKVTNQRTIHDLVAVMKQLNDDLEKVEEVSKELLPDLGDLLEIAEQIDAIANAGVKIPNMQPSIEDEVNVVDEQNNKTTLDKLKETLDKISDQLAKEKQEKEMQKQIEDALQKDSATSAAQVGKLNYKYYSREVEDKVLDALRHINTSTKLRNISNLLAAHNGYIARVERNTNRGKLDTRQVVRQFPDIFAQTDQRPNVYQQTQVQYLPRLKVLTVFDVSGSMEATNMVLKPFFSKFYQEGLSALFDIKMADFSQSVILENWEHLPQGAYYYEIAGEGGTDPLHPANLARWRAIIEEVKPDAICFYTDGEYSALNPGEDPIESLKNYFKTLGVDLVEGFAVSDNINHIDQLDPIIEKTLDFLSEVVEKKYQRYSGREMEL